MMMGLFARPALGSRIPLPPRKLIDEVGGGDFSAVGEEFLRYFTELAGLQPGETVLDIGSGCGRMAVPLTRYLDGRARYEGFDIQGGAVRWCQKHITRRFPNFRFQRADVYSKRYNRRGRYRAGEYRFPYDDDVFDFVYLTSVFTHMLRDDMEHYLDEIVRVTKPSGRCLVTSFLLNDESRGLIAADKSTVSFPDEVAHTAVMTREIPEAVVAFPEEDMRDALERRGLLLEEPIRFGDWCGRQEALSHQDIIIARRSESRD